MVASTSSIMVYTMVVGGVEGFMNDEGDVMWVVNISLPNLFNHLYFSNKKGANVTRETKKAAIHMYHHFHICPTSEEEPLLVSCYAVYANLKTV